MSDNLNATPESMKDWTVLHIGQFKPFKLADLPPGTTLVFANDPLTLSAPASAGSTDTDAAKPR